MRKTKILSVLAALTLLVSFVPLAGVQAQSSGPVIQQVKDLGTLSIPAAGPAPSIGDESALPQSLTVRPEIEGVIPRGGVIGFAAPQNAPAEPVVSGRKIAGKNPGFSGFNGLTHADQRLAGTGAYTNTQFSLEPPDQALCVGSGYVLESINTALAVYDTSGNLKAGPTALSQFFNLVPEIDRTTGVRGDFVSDPKCYYDTATRRWFLTLLQLDPAPSIRTHTLIAVSLSSNPTGAWRAFSLDTTDDGQNGTPSHPGCEQGCFGDQPLIGADAFGFYISTNEFDNAGTIFNGAQVYALSKLALASGNVPPAVVHFDNLNFTDGPAYSIQPATSPSPSQFDTGKGGTEYFLSALQLVGPYDNRIALWALTNSRSLGSSHPNVALTNQIISSVSYGMPPAANQKAGPNPLGASVGEGLLQLETNDDRMNQVVFSNGKLYSGLNTAVIVDGAEQAGIAYFVVQPGWKRNDLKGWMADQGYVAVKGQDVLFPSIGVTSEGDAIMTFTLSGPDYYPSAAYLTLGHDGGTVHIAAAGAAPEDGFSGYVAYGGAGVARWGDYSAAVASGDRIWFATEYIPDLPRTSLANWGTFIGQVKP